MDMGIKNEIEKFTMFVTGAVRVLYTIRLYTGGNTVNKEFIKVFTEELERQGIKLEVIDHDARIDAEVRESDRYLSLCSELVAMKRHIEDLSNEMCELKARLVKEKEV